MTSEATRRDRLVTGLLRAGRMRSGPIAAAMRAVPRHLFLPGVDPAVAYADEAVPTRWSADGRPTSSASQPAVVAAMLEQLDVRPGHRILEIGSGTGWNAALLAHLTGPTGAVTTIDIEPEVAAQARANLGEIPVTVVLGDGAAGHPDHAPYDRIILTAAARDLAPAWWDQLADDGRLVLPLSLRGPQRSIAFERAGDHLSSVSILECGFMPLQGLLAGVDPIRALGRPGLFLRLEDPRPLDTTALLAALDHEPGPRVTVALTEREALGGLSLWLATQDPDAGHLHAVTDTRPAPTPVLIGTDSLAALLPRDGSMAVQGFGPDGTALAGRMTKHVDDWIAAGRPSSAGLRVEAHREGTQTRFAVYFGS